MAVDGAPDIVDASAADYNGDINTLDDDELEEGDLGQTDTNETDGELEDE